MLNKTFKIIHNKYSRFFKFIFFLRYLLAIFLVFIGLFLFIPNFFDYEKRSENIRSQILKSYNLNIADYEKIEFQSLPVPKIKFDNVLIKFDKPFFDLKIKNLIIYPRFISIYNNENFQTNKVVLKDNSIILEISNLKNFLKKLLKQNKKLFIDNLNINIVNKTKPVLRLDNLKFANYGYNKNLVSGSIFDKKFKIEIKEANNYFKFELLNAGISANLNFDETQSGAVGGTLKSKIINNNLKLNFNHNDKILKIFNSYFRSKNLSFKNNSTITFDPFFDISSVFDIEEINPKIFEKINFEKFLSSKNIIKKINLNSKINFKSQKFNRSLIDNLKLNLDLAYGYLNYSKKILISENLFQCSGRINLLEEYPLLFFNCSIFSEDKKKMFKKFSIKTKDKNEIFKLKAQGNISLINKKINFKNISVNENYNATKEDLKFFKEIFEKKLYDENFFKIFNLKKIKTFILEIS